MFYTIARNLLFRITNALSGDMQHLYPIPDPEGLAKTQELFLNRHGVTLSNEEAYEVLNRVMRYLFLINTLTNTPTCADTPSTPENPTTTAR